jgi:glycosyl transferase family 87
VARRWLFPDSVSDIHPGPGITPRYGRFPYVSPKILVLSAALIAAALKIYCAATTFGSCDITIHARFGQIIDAAGIDQMYRADPRFNHPPLTGEFFGLLYHVSSYISPPTPGSVPRSFSLLLRFPSILADFFSVLILLRLREKTGGPPVWSLVVFALSPVAFMVSGFHGNVDPIMVCVLLIAAYFCVEEHVLLSGIFLALACSIKIIPLFLTPVFFFFWLHRGKKPALQFTIAFVVSCLAGWSGAWVDSPTYFLKNVLGYSSYAGGWGITYCLFRFHAFRMDLDPKSLDHLLALLVALKALIVVLVIALAWLRRKQTGPGFVATIGLAWTCFMIFAPGFIPYYLIWMAPFVLLYSATWYAVLTAASSIYLFAYYNTMSHGMPWNASDPSVPPAWNDWGVIPWLVAVAIGIGALIFGREGNALSNLRRAPKLTIGQEASVTGV